jgi:hypothetical protein
MFSAGSVGQREFLVDSCHSVLTRLNRITEVKRLSPEEDFALVAGVRARQALYQCGFPRAVLAHQGVYLTGEDLQRNIIQRLNPGK